jgi:hypothetical protein
MKHSTRNDLAKRYGKSLRTIDRWIESGRIGHLKIAWVVLFTEQHVQQFEKKHEVKAGV